MAYCKNCGVEISEDVIICPSCGVQQKPLQTQGSGVSDVGGFGWGLLGFCIPVVGLVLYLVWQKDRPLTAKAAGIGALSSVIAGVILSIMYVIIAVYLISNAY